MTINSKRSVYSIYGSNWSGKSRSLSRLSLKVGKKKKSTNTTVMLPTVNAGSQVNSLCECRPSNSLRWLWKGCLKSER